MPPVRASLRCSSAVRRPVSGLIDSASEGSGDWRFAPVGRAEGEVQQVLDGLQPSAISASVQTSPSAGDDRADRQAGEDHVFLDPVEGGVQPRPEHAELAGVTRDLAVHAVEHEREVDQDATGDHPGPLSGGEAQRRRHAQGDRDQRDLVGREPAPGRPAGDVASRC